jgi:hypothetical protein
MKRAETKVLVLPVMLDCEKTLIEAFRRRATAFKGWFYRHKEFKDSATFGLETHKFFSGGI